MAPIDEHPCVATEHLILKSPRKFYKAYMHASHWQLRAFVDSPKPNHIHYLGWRDIYEVNTSTRVRKIIGTIPFSPRCFTSANGLLCAGGDDGKFSVIRISDSDITAQHQREVDDALDSIDRFDRLERPWLPPSARALAHVETPTEQPEADVKTFGTQILNCITMWFPHEYAEEDAYTDPVAVIASNDNHIFIVDLGSTNLIQKLHHDEPVNLGKISPDGSVLVVVGDDPYMHVYKRTRVSHNPKLGRASDTFEWEKFSQTKLPGQRLGNTDDMRGSFTGSFSHRYLAIGTQYGEIAIFELEHLKHFHYPKPAVVFKSTRPNTKEGAIRSIHFNPSSSLDLLAITEDSGRVVVIDVRHFGKRQMLETDQEGEYDEVRLKEHKDGPSNGSTPTTADPDTDEDASVHGSALTRQARLAARNTTHEETRRDMDSLSPYGNRSLSRDEMGVLLAMQTSRRRRDVQATDEASRERERGQEGEAPTSSALTTTHTVVEDPAAPPRRTAPRSDERLRAIGARLGAHESPMQTAARLDAALTTHLARHRERRDRLEAERREAGRQITADEAEADAIEARQARAMAEMMAVDAANLRQRASADFFDLDRLRERGLHRTAATMVRITNSFARAEQMERQRREENGEEPLSEDRRFHPPFGLLRRPLERREPRMINRPRSPAPLDAEASVTAPLPAAVEAGPSDETAAAQPPPVANPPTPAGILGEGRRYRVSTVWGRGPTRSFLTESDYPGSRYSDEESLSPEERARLQQRREESRRQALTWEQTMTRRLQGRNWVPPEQIAQSGREFAYVRSSATQRNQTTGCAWSPDGRTLYVGTEGGLYEYQVNIADRKIHPAFKLR